MGFLDRHLQQKLLERTLGRNSSIKEGMADAVGVPSIFLRPYFSSGIPVFAALGLRALPPIRRKCSANRPSRLGTQAD